MANLHVKLPGRDGAFGVSEGHYLVDARIVDVEDEGRMVSLVVTRVESREIRVSDTSELTELVLSSLRELGDDAGPTRSVLVVREIDRALAKAKVDDPQWADVEKPKDVDSDDLL